MDYEAERLMSREGPRLEDLRLLFEEKRKTLHVMDCLSLWALEYQTRIFKKIRYISKKDPEMVDNITEKIIYTIEKNNKIIVYNPGSCPLDTRIIAPREEGITLLEALLEDTMEPIKLKKDVKNKIIFEYKTSWGEVYELAEEENNIILFKNIREILKSIISINIDMIIHGRTPRLPIWLHPITISIIPETQKEIEYARWLQYSLNTHGINTLLLEPPGSPGKRLRKAAKLWIPVTVLIGPREMASGTVILRKRWRTGTQEVKTLAGLVEEVSLLLAAHGVLGSPFILF